MRVPPWIGVACALVALLAAACSTVEGVGKDVKAAGQAIERAAKTK